MISFVYFDIGGVALLDYSGTNKWSEMKQALGVTGNDIRVFDRVWKKYEKEICVSRDVDSLIPIFEKEIGIRFSQTYSMLMDFVNRFDPNPSLWPVIESIRRNRGVGLLSNMYPRMFEAIQERNILPPVPWDVVIDSSAVGCQKPERKIYELGQKKAAVKNEEILFVENSPTHIQAAKEFGWQTFLYDPKEPVRYSKDLAAFFDAYL